jgi:hypothetical protein
MKKDEEKNGEVRKLHYTLCCTGTDGPMMDDWMDRGE